MSNPFQENPFQTRDDVARAVLDLVDPLIPFASAGGARFRLGETGARHDEASADLEGYARPLWGIAPLAAGGYDFPHWEIWRNGLAHGTDPDHPEFWGWPGDSDQRLVEMAAIGFALRLVPEHIWRPLSDAAKQNVAKYLTRAHRSAYPVCNWKFFRLLISLGLKHVGHPVDDALDAEALADIDSYSLGGGWYNDGKPRQVDHYIPFAFHYYGLLLAALGDDPDRAALFRSRARDFTQDIQHWYAADGSALPFGRSLAYRFAHAGIWGALAFGDTPALPWGQIKGHYLRNLRWWASKPIFDHAGLLTIGYTYPNLLMSEGYNAPGSPYWAMKAFLPLALPADHPFWIAEEEDAPKTRAPHPIPQAGHVMQALPGHQVALTTGQELGYMRHGAEKYAKFAYSTRYGLSVEVDERQFEQITSDNMLTLSDDGIHFRMRERHEDAGMAGDLLYSRWQPFADVTVESFTLPAGHWHLRLHEITTPRPLSSIEGGFAIARPAAGPWRDHSDGACAHLETETDLSIIRARDFRLGKGYLTLPNSNLMHARTIVPQLIGRIDPGVTRLASAILAQPMSALVPPLPDFPDIAELRDRYARDGQPVPGPKKDQRSQHQC